MGKNVILTSEGARQFSHALELLNNSINEFNQIAEQMIPQNLITDGLTNYLSDFCKSLEADSKLKIVFTSEGENINADEHVDSTIFRSFRAVLFMLLKYSRPNSISIKLSKTSESIKLLIKDDGEINIFKNSNIVKYELENIYTILNPFNGNLNKNTFINSGNELEICIDL